MATKHHNLQTVVQGVDNWDIPLNANFVEIDKGPTIKATAGETLSSYKVVPTCNNILCLIAYYPSMGVSKVRGPD